MAAVLTVSFLIGNVSPSLAAESAVPAMEPRSTLAGAASAKVDSLTNEEVAQAAAQSATPAQDTNDGGFFKSGKGKVALVMLVAATGFTIYSKYNDRVKSVIR